MNLSEILERNARMYPNDIALIERLPSQDLRRQITWKQFNERVNRIANALLEAGIKKGDRVLHFMKNRMEWMESYFAIIRIGAIVVPLNFRFTSIDLEYVVKIVDPALTMVENDLAQIIGPVRAHLEKTGK